jgi:hypothetical protein
MKKPPRVLSLVFCDRLDVNLAARQTSLVGLFHARTIARFPAHAGFTVYTALHGGRGEGTMKLTVIRLETEKEIYAYRRWWAPPGQGLSVHVELRITKCIFQAPGRYLVSLFFDDEELDYRYLDIFRARRSL